MPVLYYFQADSGVPHHFKSIYSLTDQRIYSSRPVFELYDGTGYSGGCYYSGKSDRKIFYATFLYYFLWVCFSDKIIYALSDPKPQIDFLIENYYFYKAPAIAGLFVVTLMISIFIGIIDRYEEEISGKNKELERRVMERTQKLSETYDRIVNVGFMTSHEIRGPLASILGITRLFIDNKNIHGLDQEINKLHEKSQEMDRVINRMTRELEHSPDSKEL